MLEIYEKENNSDEISVKKFVSFYTNDLIKYTTIYIN